jgi:hypothetical protein
MPPAAYPIETCVAIVSALNRLRDNEGATVTFICDNPDFNSGPDRVVIVNDQWTNHEDRRFGGATLLDAISAAERAKAQAEKHTC